LAEATRCGKAQVADPFGNTALHGRVQWCSLSLLSRLIRIQAFEMTAPEYEKGVVERFEQFDVFSDAVSTA